MTAWYESAFGRDYLSLYPHRNECEATRDVAGILRLIDPSRTAPLLDLCCGAGRHLVALRRAGFTCLTGLDLSADLLNEARSRLLAESMGDIQLVKADMRDIPEEGAYSTIVSLFTSFGYFEDGLEDERVLQSVYRALATNGTLLLDTLNRNHILANLNPSEETEQDGKRITVRRHISSDGLRVEKETRINQPGSPETTYRESVRMYTMDEIHAMLRGIGFVDVRFYGSLDGAAFSDESPRMVFVASKVE
ncbi:class I SAM-dependent methyltransferase [Candidatus Bipolaricaulota bacterium]